MGTELSVSSDEEEERMIQEAIRLSLLTVSSPQLSNRDVASTPPSSNYFLGTTPSDLPNFADSRDESSQFASRASSRSSSISSSSSSPSSSNTYVSREFQLS